jgi:hypothetical protein
MMISIMLQLRAEWKASPEYQEAENSEEYREYEAQQKSNRIRKIISEGPYKPVFG